MRLEFNGLVLDATREELQQGFTLAVGNSHIVLTPGYAAPPAPTDGTNVSRFYRLRFYSAVPNKINTIKCIREFLRLGLGEAKALVEGRTMDGLPTADCIITGPAWETSQFYRALCDVASGCFSVSPCPSPAPNANPGAIAYQ